MKLANLKTLIGVVGVCLIFIIAQTSQVSAISVKELLGLKKAPPELTKDEENASIQTGDASTNIEWSKSSGHEAAANPQIDLDYVTLLLANMNQQEREKVLANQDLFKQVIESEANNRSTVSAAIANNLVEDRNVEFLMRRGEYYA